MLGRWARTSCAFVLAFAVYMPDRASGQTAADADRLTVEVERLYQAGKFTEAIPIARQAIAITEKVLGPDHPSLGQPLFKLAELYWTQRNYAEAEPLMKRSLDLYEKALGPDHPHVATALYALAALYHAQNRYSEAEPLNRRSLAIREQTLGPEHPEVAMSLSNLAVLLRAQGRYQEAETLYVRALAIQEKSLGPDHPNIATVLKNLALLYEGQGRYGEAEPLYRRRLALYEKTLAPDHPNVATALYDLAWLYRAQGRTLEAEQLATRSLVIREKMLGPDHPEVGKILGDLAQLYQAQGRYSEAEPLFKRSLAIAEKALGPAHAQVGTALNNLAEFYRAQGRYSEAEPLLKRGLSLYERAMGPNRSEVALSLNNLAGLYQAQGRFSEAEPLFKRSLTVYEMVLGPEHPDVALALNNLALLYSAEGRTAEAEPLNRRSLAIWEKALGPEHPNVAMSLNNLAQLYQAEGRFSEAELLFKRTLAIAEKTLGLNHPHVGRSLNNLAELYRVQGRNGEAEPLYSRSLAIAETALGPEHPDVAMTFSNRALLALAQDDLAGAADRWRRATALLQRRAVRGIGGGTAGSSKGEAQKNWWYFAGLVKTTYRLKANGRSAHYAVRDTFETAQWAHSSEAAASLAQMAARSAGGSPNLSALVRERQDLVAEWQAKDKRLIVARSEPPANRNATDEKALADRLAAIDARLTAIDARLAKDFPDYAALTSPKAISVADVQSALRDDEALILTLDTDGRFNPLPEETFVWVVTKSEVRWVRSALGTEGLKREVAALRCGLDATSWDGDGGKRCADLLKLPIEKAPAAGDPLPFDVARAHALYQSLFGDASDLIRGKHLFVVPSGALTILPFQVLVTKAQTSSDLASASWLIREHAITVLPSVASLAALRHTGKPSTAAKPMIGFANPLLEGNQTDPRDAPWYQKQAQRAREQTGCAATPKQRTVAQRTIRRNASPIPQSAGIADLAQIKMQTPLPETADEVCEVARSLGADPADMRIGAKATETEVKRLSETGELATYRILHFATHGVLAGQLSGTRESGLILTPPETATAQDDGYLSGSEIAGLKLNADWVILSACNTAGGAGEDEAAEALSGLARVFFYAGARALLVSHWAVDSDAAVKLVTGAVSALAKDRRLGRAEALRQAMVAAMADTTRPDNWVSASHPSVWAPFVLVGEGGAGR
jgi:tetratricopeptide (TPR) repeat protein/CHAT domain-containing protein